MTFDIIIPWQERCPYRRLALDWVVDAHDSFLRTVILGHLDPDVPWSKARAVQAGLAHSTADIIVMSDGDVWCDSIEVAVDAAETSGWAVPFGYVHRLTPAATSHAIQTGDLGGQLEQRPYLGVPGGGMVAIQRELYDRIPLDPRFVGWGQEDEAWGIALTQLAGRPWRGKADLYHLWHPAQPRQNRATGSEASRVHRNRYMRARRHSGEMQALITEAINLLNIAV